MDFALEAHIDEFRYPRGTGPAILSIDFDVRPGEFVAVVGPAGAGKTTLCHCLSGVIPHFRRGAYRGSVMVGGRNLSDMRLPEIAPLVGFVQQRPENQLFNLTAEEDVAFGPENLCRQPEETRKRVDDSLAFVGMEGFASRSPDTLSGGEAQRIVLASILAMGPELFVLDQPAAELDPPGRKLMYANLCRLNREDGRTVVLVEDRLDDVLPFLTRVILMLDGRIARDAAPDEFFADETLPSLGIRVPHSVSRTECPGLRTEPAPAPPFDGYHPVASGPVPDASRSVASELLTRSTGASRPGAAPEGASDGCHVADKLRRYSSQHSAPGTRHPSPLEVQDLGFRYPKSDGWAVKGVNLGFHQGEFVAVIGGNGAGKTTLLKQMAGRLRPTEGRVLVGGRDIRAESPAQLVGIVGFLFQDPDYQLFCNSVFDEVAFGLKIAKVPPAQIVARVDLVLERLGLLPLKERHPYTLSRGQRQRLALASILVREPSVLLVDEPSTGLDYRETIQIMELLAEFGREGGIVVMITHDMEMVLRYAERVIVMAGGRVELDSATARSPTLAMV